MRTPRLRSVLILVLLVAVLAAAAAGLGGAGRTPAAQAGPAAATSHWCNFVLAGKNATADGSVLMGYNNDWSANNYVYLQAVPGDATHNKYVKLYTWGGVPEGGINEHQLGALYGTATDLDKSVLAADPYVKKGYGGEIWDLILQQCTTAQQAITLLGQMAQTGFTSGAAGSFAVGDPERGLGLRAARRPPLGRPARARQRLPRPPEHGDRPPGQPEPTPPTSAARPTSSPSPRASAATAPSDGPFDVAWAYDDRTDAAVVLQHQPSLGRLQHGRSVARPHAGDALRDAARVRGARPQDHAAGDPDHLPLPLRGHEHRPDAELHADEPARADQPAHLLLDDRLQRRVAAALVEARRHRRRHVGRAVPPVLERLRALLRLDHERPDGVDEQDGLQRVPRPSPTASTRTGPSAASSATSTTSRWCRAPTARSRRSARTRRRAPRRTAAGLTGAARITYLTNYSAQRATQAQSLAAGLPAQMP